MMRYGDITYAIFKVGGVRKIYLLILSSMLASCNLGAVQDEVINAGHNLHFESPEHFILGSEIYLKYPNEQVEQGSNSYVAEVTLSNSKQLKLTFAELVYLAGDFMGNPSIQIGSSNVSDQESAFLSNFNTIYQAPNKDYLPKIISLVNQQTRDNSDNIIAGKELNLPNDTNRKYNCATGGGCYVWNWLFKQGLYLKLANVNYDHFGQYAIDSYLAGHLLALKTAALAKESRDISLLRKAYAYEAYSHHFLTDLAASGHIRTPRKEIAKWCSHTPYTISLFLANAMHEEDNKNGIYVTDFNSESWLAYGDAEMFIDGNSQSLNNLILRMQKSVNQIYEVYSGNISIDDAYKSSHRWLPDLEKIKDDPRNSPVLFKMENNKLMEYNKKVNNYKEVSNCVISALKYL